MPARVDPAAEMRILDLQTLSGSNYWSPEPVTRVDLDIGRYEEISSADAIGFTDALVAALPGLIEHRCSLGRRGGFIERLRRGTYAAHIVEHVALELQDMIGHRVGFGRARGGEGYGRYIVVFEHRHSEVGRAAAAAAFETVRRGFAREPLVIDSVVECLRAKAGGAERSPKPREHVACAIMGGSGRAAIRDAIMRAGPGAARRVVDLSARQLLDRGLPYASCDAAVLAEGGTGELPERFAGTEGLTRLRCVVVESVRSGGYVIAPAGARELALIVRDNGVSIATFGEQGGAARARIHATRAGDRLVVLEGDGTVRDEAVGSGAVEVQLAALLVTHLLERNGR
jgi:hypothetical protein